MPVYALWSAPRARSTAFFRSMLERGDMVVFRHFWRALGRLPADLVRLLVKLVFVSGRIGHAINLVSAFAVKSTMGTTRA